MTHRKLAVGAIIAAWLGGPAYAADTSMRLFPIASLFVPDGEAGKWVTKEFTQAVNAPEGGRFFAEAFRKSFPDSAGDVNDANKRRTFVVSLQIPRASLYRVEKVDGTTDVYLPITGSIYFTNLVTGEVLYTVTRTHYHVSSLLGKADTVSQEKIGQLFLDSYKTLVGELLDSAKQQFHPTIISASVKSVWNGLFILDRGEDHGIAQGDALADAEMNTLRIVSTGATYSVGALELGKAAVGKSFMKQTNQTLDELKKPRVMILVDKVPDKFSTDVVRQMFADELGNKAPVSVIHVNPMFSNILATSFSKSNISSEESGKRKLPDFFVRLSIPEAIDFELPTNLRYKTKRSYLSIATAELVDRTGRVLYATQGKDRIDDDVTSGMTFDRASRRDISLKNALLTLAQQFNAELKFKKLELPITPQADGVAITDELGVLTMEQATVVYRNIGRIEGITGDVKVPITRIKVKGVSDGAARAALDLGFSVPKMEVQTGDIVRISTSQQAPTITRKRFVACGTVEKLGSVALSPFGDLALNVFAKSANTPFFIPEFGDQLAGLLGKTTRFEDSLTLAKSTYDYCVEPVYRIDVADRLCEGEPQSCAQTAMVRITYRIKQGQAVVAKSGLETKMTSARFYATVAPDAEKSTVEADLLDEISKMAPIIVEKLSKSQLN
jgi:hypothetical protein